MDGVAGLTTVRLYCDEIGRRRARQTDWKGQKADDAPICVVGKLGNRQAAMR